MRNSSLLPLLCHNRSSFPSQEELACQICEIACLMADESLSPRSSQPAMEEQLYHYMLEPIRKTEEECCIEGSYILQLSHVKFEQFSMQL